MTPEQLNTLSGALTQLEGIVEGLKVALAIATNGYQTDEATLNEVRTQLEDEKAAHAQDVAELTAKLVPTEDSTMATPPVEGSFIDPTQTEPM